jgi:hypothetical protein
MLDEGTTCRGEWVARRRPVAEPWNIPPQPAFHRRRGLALSVVNVTGHLNTASLGDEGVIEEACP